MPPFFRFMTGASSYRINARDKREAIQIAFEELNPNEDAQAIILQTLYDEEEGLRFSSPDAAGSPDASGSDDPRDGDD